MGKIMEWILFFSFIYLGLVIPFKYWQVLGKYEYLKKDADAKINQLEYDRNYYIEQINDYKKQVKHLSNAVEEYKWMWIEATSDLERIENVLHDEDPSELTDKLFEILLEDEVGE